ncbi:MAG: hypothetical protein E4H03_09215 [Myxococcales bacterium]|jgi:hypothetical protein|nr:MAG: hypothetical protein E4H03_09215 [Myxococcales bacterium]
MVLILAVIGFVLVNGAMIHYFMTIAKETVPEDLRPHAAVLVLGAAIGAAAIGLSPSAATIALGVPGVAFAAFLLWLFGQRRVPDGSLIARVGELMPKLEAPDQDGKLVRLSDMKGQRVMFKFFRGFW